MTNRRRLKALGPTLGAIGALVLTLLGCQPADWTPIPSTAMARTPTTTTSHPAPSAEEWADNSFHGSWQAVYNGYGSIHADLGGVVLSPRASVRPDETHAALVAATAPQTDFTVRMRTLSQLRQGAPNPWEVAWVLWGYLDPNHFYYLALKPNGWEVGKADPAYPGAQRFIGGNARPSYPIGPWYEVRVQHTSGQSTLWVNGVALTTVTDAERPYIGGTVALYTEDATVEFRPLQPAVQ